ncbi:GDP-mannose 4,6-dehydratase, partial [Enterococcus faecalis]|uniref:GDP-mannose 4,6-dehydratase n=1 Tax=Enterococcus faecalis TaxID=1351 RepID=UPI0025540924
MKKLLITGGAGFIGSNLANFYSQQYQVFVIDDLSMGRVSNLQQTEQLVFIKGSVTDQQLLDEVLSKHSFEYIFHLAAVASSLYSLLPPPPHPFFFFFLFFPSFFTKKNYIYFF